MCWPALRRGEILDRVEGERRKVRDPSAVALLTLLQHAVAGALHRQCRNDWLNGLLYDKRQPTFGF